MAKIILYIAQSKDGFIATKDGGVDWLNKYNGTKEDYGYFSFIETIGTVILGNATYKQIQGFGPYPYKGKDSYVFTRNTDLTKDENVQFVSGDIKTFTQQLKQNTTKDIWLVGGAKLFEAFVKESAVDELIITTFTDELSEGVPLFLNETQKDLFEEVSSKEYENGATQKVFKSKQ